jgi:hypothetical protein
MNTELNELKALLSMAVNEVIAELLNVDLDRVRPGARLVADLGMCPTTRKRLQREMAFIFDCEPIDIPPAMKVEELLDRLAEIEFARLEDSPSPHSVSYPDRFRANA